MVYWFPKAVVTKCYKLGGLKEQILFSHFWRLEIQYQGVSRAMICWKSLGEDPPSPLLSSGGCMQSLAFHAYGHARDFVSTVTWYFSLCLSIFSSHKNTSHWIGAYPHLV